MDLGSVAHVSPSPSRSPPRARVIMTGTEVTPEVRDVLDDDMIAASIEEPEVTPENTLAFDAIIGTRWKPAGVHTIYKPGNSTAVILPREALDISGLAKGQKVAEYAADGEIRIVALDDA